MIPELLTMTYLTATDTNTRAAGLRFRDLLARPGILEMPGAHNGMAALQAKQAVSPLCICRAPR